MQQNIMKQLPRTFFARDAITVARDLLGKVLQHNQNGDVISGRIVEVESYLGEIDAAAHAFKGKTKRNQSLYLDAGHAYVHSIHMQNCLDIVVATAGVPASVLIRALEPITGLEQMQVNRNKENLRDLTSGPGKLCQALGIDKSLDGVDICIPDAVLKVLDDGYKVPQIVQSKRVGISKASEHEYRYYIADSIYVSKK
jgi:DNA-3-methyladenine glycosylase